MKIRTNGKSAYELILRHAETKKWGYGPDLMWLMFVPPAAVVGVFVWSIVQSFYAASTYIGGV